MKKTAALAAVLLLSACAGKQYAPVAPLANGSFHVDAYGRTEAQARERAFITAQTECRRDKKRWYQESLQTSYRGVFEERTADQVDLAGQILKKAAGVKIPGVRGREDFGMHLTFGCR